MRNRERKRTSDGLAIELTQRGREEKGRGERDGHRRIVHI